MTHSIATMVDALRADAGTVGLVSANGGFLTKHAIGLYSSEPGTDGFRAEDVQDEVDRIPATPVDTDHTGAVTIEAYTVMHDAEGPEVGLCALRTPTGARTWGRVADRGAAGEMLTTELIGAGGDLDPDGVVALVGAG